MEVSGEFNALTTLPPRKDYRLPTVWEGGSQINAAVEINIECVNEI
jgi:hypothetical protein